MDPRNHSSEEINACIANLKAFILNGHFDAATVCCGEHYKNGELCCGEPFSAIKEISTLIEAYHQERSRRREAQAECLEQARIIGMSAERELSLRSKVSELERALLRSLSPERSASTEPIWISVNDGLPKDGSQIVGRSSTGSWTEKFDSEEPLGSMTHWRPADHGAL